MVKVTDQQKRRAEREKALNEEDRRRKQSVFPKCIGMFPECEKVTAIRIIKDCYKCPYFSKVRYMSFVKKLSAEDIEKNPDLKRTLEELGETPEEYIARVRKDDPEEKQKRKEQLKKEKEEIDKRVMAEVMKVKENNKKFKLNYKTGVYIGSDDYVLFLKRAQKRKNTPEKFVKIVNDNSEEMYLSPGDIKYLDRKIEVQNKHAKSN